MQAMQAATNLSIGLYSAPSVEGVCTVWSD